MKRDSLIVTNERGVVAVIVALLLIVFLGMAALAVDVGHIKLARNELQNAADATALSAANHLFQHTPVYGPPFPAPDGTAANSEASDAIKLNKADGAALASCQTECGYWDMNTAGPSVYWGACSGAIAGPSPIPTNLAPAVRVLVAKSGSGGLAVNGGALQHWFARILGINSSAVSAKATAVLRSPGRIRSGATIPVAVSKVAYDAVSIGTTISISNHGDGSDPTYGGSLAGQWTTFLSSSPPSTNYVRDLIQGGNPDGLTINQSVIYLTSGVHNSLYAGGGDNPSINHNYAGMDVFLPVVPDVLLPSSPTSGLVVGIVGFHIDYARGGSDKVIVGHFTTAIYNGSGPPGPGWGPLDYAGLVE